MSEITPAMTPEEWAVALAAPPVIHPDKRHAAAALWLYGQSFGFTQNEVALLRSVAHNGRLGVYVSDGPQPADEMRVLAAKIAALLPPVA